jgi:Flp pilus assembly protein CpaB
MLPTLTAFAVRRRPPRRALAGASGTLLIALALVLTIHGSGTPVGVAPAATMAEILAPHTWAISVPIGWFAAPIAGLRPGDRVDVLALRPGDRPNATAVAFDLVVVSADDRAVVFGTGADDATALGVARASGQLLIPLLRSTR